MAEKDPLLQGLVNKFYGLRLVGVEDLFEALCWAIIGQQINLTFAYTLKRRFIETFGTAINQANQTYWMFPGPNRVAQLSPEDITPLKFSRKKAEYVIDVAKRMDSGQMTKQKLLAMNNFEAIFNALTKIRGIGNWTANYVMMRCLKYYSAFPIQDIGLQNAVKQQLELDRKPTFEELREMAAHWKGWEAYATFYLWRSKQGLSA
jgi:DNA-3-methyladenine glycosylase II